jgi:Flp pilus assembly pilin Flp
LFGGLPVSDFVAIIGLTRAIGGAATPKCFGRFSSVAPMPSRIKLTSPQGQTMAEYAVILTVISVGVLAALALLGTNVVKLITDVAGRIPL